MEKSERKLSGAYFKHNRQIRVFEDFTAEEQEALLDQMSEKMAKSLCRVLADALNRVGEEFSIYGGYDDGEEVSENDINLKDLNDKCTVN